MQKFFIALFSFCVFSIYSCNAIDEELPSVDKFKTLCLLNNANEYDAIAEDSYHDVTTKFELVSKFYNTDHAREFYCKEFIKSEEKRLLSGHWSRIYDFLLNLHSIHGDKSKTCINKLRQSKSYADVLLNYSFANECKILSTLEGCYGDNKAEMINYTTSPEGSSVINNIKIQKLISYLCKSSKKQTKKAFCYGAYIFQKEDMKLENIDIPCKTTLIYDGIQSATDIDKDVCLEDKKAVYDSIEEIRYENIISKLNMIANNMNIPNKTQHCKRLAYATQNNALHGDFLDVYLLTEHILLLSSRGMNSCYKLIQQTTSYSEAVDAYINSIECTLYRHAQQCYIDEIKAVNYINLPEISVYQKQNKINKLAQHITSLDKNLTQRHFCNLLYEQEKVRLSIKAPTL